MKKIDFLAIGDITTDVFIKLKNAELSCDIDELNCKIAMKFGEKIPYESAKTIHAVGNSANASVSASRLGISSALLTHLGDDKIGRECIKTLKRNGVETYFCNVERGVDSNHHYVLSYKTERTILVKHNQFNYDFERESKKLPVPKLLYFSSVGEDTLTYHNDLADWVQENNIKMAFQPGTYQIKLGTKALVEIYKNTEYFFCNIREAQRILETESRDMDYLLKELHKLGPKITFITDGVNGAYAYDSYENKTYYQPAYTDPDEVVDRTGAGDSFASTVSVALLLGKSLKEALSWGPINARSVIEYVGAQEGLLSRDELEHYLAQAPESYRTEEV